MKAKPASPLIIILLSLCFTIPAFAYRNFKVAVYCRAQEVQHMDNQEWLDSAWNIISTQVHVDKVYIETHRDGIIVEKAIIEKVKKYFNDRQVETAGGITYTINEANFFETFCYSNPEQRNKAKEIAEYTAGLFDEFILDDFFFTSCKCNLCIAGKGDKSWTDYRLGLMKEAAENLVVKPAKMVNPDVKVVIKYPNWYEHFQGLGFNLEAEPGIFDGIYTGTETRDPVLSNQHLQQYESYLIYRYFGNIKPGGNGGGWVDPFGIHYADRYAEQLWLTLFAKAPEITLFDFRSIMEPVDESLKVEWQGHQTSFNFDEMVLYSTIKNKELKQPNFASIAGYSFSKADVFMDMLGNPVGVKSYKPYHSRGEDFLQNYLGMAGIPMDIVPEFPEKAGMVFLTEAAATDPEIVAKIKNQLVSGKNVMITSGLLRTLQGKGIEDIVELKYSDRKSMVNQFLIGRSGIYPMDDDILIPQIEYLTNDSWEIISGMDSGLGWPFLHMANYGNGVLYILTIPENFADLYNLPVEVLNKIKEILTGEMNVRLEAPGKVSLILYDNNTFIVESFLDHPEDVKIITDPKYSAITDQVSGISFQGTVAENINRYEKSKDEKSFKFTIKPHSFMIFKMN